LTKDEYAEKVRDVATAMLTECNAEEWKLENEDAGFYDFVSHADYDGSYHSVIDACFDATDWKDAIEILQITEQDPDHVDSGLYEGCNWKRILVIIAFEVFTWDVNAVAEEMYDAGDFPRELVAYPDTQHQKGFFPNNKKFKIPDGPWVVDMHDAIKILLASRKQNYKPEFSVVFEGNVEKRGKNHIRYIVDCRRVYNQTQTDIDTDLERCKEEFGVREFG
jgi:hypothetical protein